MGNNTSVARSIQDVKNNIYNRNSISVVNETVNKFITDITVESVKTCSLSVITKQDIKIGNIVAEEDVELDISQYIKTITDFSCIQKNEIRTEIINKIMTDLSANIESVISSDVLTEMQANAESYTEGQLADFLSRPTNTETEVDLSIENNITSIQERDIKNILRTCVETNFSYSFYDSCIGKVVNMQGFELGNVSAGGTVNINVKQSTLTEAFQKCIQSTDVGAKILEDFAVITDVETRDTAKTKTEDYVTSKISITTKILGFLEGIFGFGDLGNMVATGLIICCCCLCCLLMLFLGFRLIRMGRQPQAVGQIGGWRLFKRQIPIYSPPSVDTLGWNR